MGRIQAIRQQAEPQIRNIIKESNSKFMAILDEEQDAKFASLLKKKFKDVEM